MTSQRLKRTVGYLLLAACMVIIFLFSHQGHEVSSGQSMGIVNAVSHTTGVQLPETVVRKSAHVLIYFILGILAYNVAMGYRYSRRLLIIGSIVFVCLYAISDEAHQYFVSGRSAEVGDVLLDTTAGSLGIVGYNWVINRQRREDK